MARRDFPEVPGYLKPTIGSTEVASGATVTTVAGLTLSNPTLTGTLTAGGGVGTSGQVLQSTGSAVQWATPTSSTPAATRTTLGGFYGFPGGLTYSTSNSNVAIGGRSFGGDDGGNTSVNSYQNCIIGYAAMGAMNTASYNNTAIGYYAGGNVGAQGNGEDNTLIGMQCGNGYYQGASRNTSVGASSMTTLTTSSDNTGIGYTTLSSNTGSQNVAIGSYTAFNKTTGNNTITIGYQAHPSTNTVSNQITLGNSSISSLRCQVTSISGLSDARDKSDVENLSVGLDFINTLRPVKFTWDLRPEKDKDGNDIISDKNGELDMGFIAQDLVSAEDSTGLADYLKLTLRDNPEKLEATAGRLIPILVKAIQELSTEIEILKNR